MEEKSLRRVLEGAALGYLAQGASGAMARSARDLGAADTPVAHKCTPPPAPPFHIQRLFCMSVADVSARGAATRVVAWAKMQPARTVFAADLAHALHVSRHRAFAGAHAAADMVVGASRAVVWLSRRENTPLDGPLTGADLLEPIVSAAASEGLSVFLVGKSHAELHACAKTLKAKFPQLELRGMYAPTRLEVEEPDQSDLIGVLHDARPEIILVGLATPDQEVWADAVANLVRHGVFVGLGSALNNTLGEPAYIPIWVDAYGLFRLWRFWRWLRRELSQFIDICWNFPMLLGRHRRDRRQYQAALNRIAQRRALNAPYSAARTQARDEDRATALDSALGD